MHRKILTPENLVKLVASLAIVSLMACSSTQNESDQGDLIEPNQPTTTDNPAPENSEESVKDAVGFEDDEPAKTADADQKKQDPLEQSVASENGSAPAPTPEPMPDTASQPTDELTLDAEPAPPADQTAAAPPPDIIADPSPSAPVPEEAPPAETSSSQMAKITNIQFKANDNGGTVVIEASGPISYTTRTNSDQNQFVVEIPNSTLPAKLKRPFNTRDFGGNVGSIDAYQAAGSTTSNVVIQLRPGAPAPIVQQEGNALLVMTNSGSNESPVAAGNTNSDQGGGGSPPAVVSQQGGTQEEGAILPGRNLEEFLSGNQKYYGTPIFIETDDMDLRSALRFIADESGANLVISDEIKGNISLKLRNVPWDQALVVIMKAKKLGYTRQGNIIRISPLTDIRAEEEEAQKAAASRRTLASLKVRMFPVSFAKMDDLAKQIQPFLTKDRGQVVGDGRTNALIVTDTEEVLEKVEKIVRSLDIPPAQVLIEGKIVEARETFNRTMGLDWSLGGRSLKLSDGSAGPVNLTPSLQLRNNGVAGNPFGFGLTVGTLDVLGDLNAFLSLGEREDKVKVISSPRILALHNEPAEIVQGSEQPFVSITTANGTTTKSVNFKPIRLKLNVTPQITADNSVIMALDVLREFAGAKVDNDTGAAPVNQRSAKTKVLVQNGQTAVIGGIYQADESNVEGGVPYLKDIPVLGYLFGYTEKNKDKTELLIFLTPRVLASAKGQQTAPVDMGGAVQ